MVKQSIIIAIVLTSEEVKRVLLLCSAGQVTVGERLRLFA